MNREQRKQMLEQQMFKTAKEEGHSIIKGRNKYYVYYDDKEWEYDQRPDEELDNPRQYLRKWYFRKKHFKNKKWI